MYTIFRSLPFVAIMLLAQCTDKKNESVEKNPFTWKAPIDEPELFAEDVIATGMNERDAALSPDGKAFYYTVQYNREINAIAYTQLIKGRWTNPKLVSFSGEYEDLEPVFHPDGKRLFFVSNRPLKDGNEPKDFDIWYVKKEADGWSEPINPGSPLNTSVNEFYPSFTSNGTIFFCAKRENSIGGEDIFYSETKNGKYLPPKNPGDSINTKSDEYNAFVSPDGSFLMYNTHGRGEGYGSGDISIAFKNDKGEWKKPINMGEKVNSEYFEFCPSLSPDGKYFFFTAQRMSKNMTSGSYTYKDLREWHNQPENGNGDIYWMDAGFLEELRKQ